MAIGASMKRVDAYEKVTGRARYTSDLAPREALFAKVVRSTVANGLVKGFELGGAKSVPGVVGIFTCLDDDLPSIPFSTAGHPWSTDLSHQDVADRLLLNRRVRIYGDDIAVVVAESELAAAKAAKLVKADYEEYPAVATYEQATAPEAAQLHEAFPGNVLKRTVYQDGISFDEAIAKEPGLTVLEETFDTQTVQHCHIEPACSFAYMESGRIVIVSSTQIPHIVRRVCGQALGLPWGKLRVIKPTIGGGFGNKQEVLYEPLNAWLTQKLGGRCVRLELSREETFACTRVRHAMRFTLKTAARKDGTLVARKLTGLSNQGGYASHGHGLVLNAASANRMLYGFEQSMEQDTATIYTNIASGGAMRGYGVPQGIFALESHMDDLAEKLGLDPIELRLKNCMELGFVDKGTNIACHSNGLAECIQKGREFIRYDEKRRAYKNQGGSIRRGVGMSIFCYKTGVYPISLETAAARIVLNQDGSVQVQMGATEIGQGADTIFAQMAAETLGISFGNVHVVSTQDTDISPFDPAAYASRQSYVSGTALKKAAELLLDKILSYASFMLDRPAKGLCVKGDAVRDISTGETLLTMAELATEAFYSLANSTHLTAEYTHHCTDNTFSFGACFAEIEVDLPLGKIKVLNIVSVHDSGRLLNPQLAQAQVHGGMSMGLGYGLSERLLFDDDARPLNGNLLDYKLMTAADTPELEAYFVETDDPTGPYGNKALGEPPAIPPAPALRNALLNATGVKVNSLPLNPQKLVEHFAAAGLIGEAGAAHV
jgi:xanthine dehydrogenase molybdenum-binding subunit